MDENNVVTVKKKEECIKVVDTVFQLLEKRITAKQIMTKKVRVFSNGDMYTNRFFPGI